MLKECMCVSIKTRNLIILLWISCFLLCVKQNCGPTSCYRMSSSTYPHVQLGFGKKSYCKVKQDWGMHAERSGSFAISFRGSRVGAVKADVLFCSRAHFLHLAHSALMKKDGLCSSRDAYEDTPHVTMSRNACSSPFCTLYVQPGGLSALGSHKITCQ